MLIPETEGQDVYSYFNFTLPGPLELTYLGETVPLEEAQYKLLYGEDSISSLTLLAHLTPAGAQQLARHIFLIASALEEGHATFRFELQPQVLKRYAQELTEALTLEACLAIGDGALKRLEYFECTGTARFE